MSRAHNAQWDLMHTEGLSKGFARRDGERLGRDVRRTHVLDPRLACSYKLILLYLYVIMNRPAIF